MEYNLNQAKVDEDRSKDDEDKSTFIPFFWYICVVYFLVYLCCCGKDKTENTPENNESNYSDNDTENENYGSVSPLTRTETEIETVTEVYPNLSNSDNGVEMDSQSLKMRR